MKECHICFVSHSENNFFTLHDSHEVCNNCLKNLQKNYISTCPFCREPLSSSIIPERSLTQISSYNINMSSQELRTARQINAESLI